MSSSDWAGPLEGRPRETGYDITVASELMAILALVDGANYAEALRKPPGAMLASCDWSQQSRRPNHA